MEKIPEPFLSFFNQIPVVAYKCVQRGVDRQFQFVTDYVQTLLGLTPEQLLADSREYFRRIHSADKKRFLEAWKSSGPLPVEVGVEYRMMRGEQELVWVKEHSVVSEVTDSEERVCQGVLTDVSHYQGLKDELERWDGELESLTRNIPDVVGRLDRKNRILYLNRWWDQPISVPPEWYLGKTFGDLGVTPKIVELFSEKIRLVLQSKTPTSLEISHPTAFGMKVFEVRFFPEPAKGREIATVLFLCRDMTAMRTAESALIESDAKFRQLAETVDSVFWIWDMELQRMIYVSPAYERLWGGDIPKLMENPFDWLTVVLPEDRGKVESLFLNRMDGNTHEVEYRILRKGKEVRWIHNQTFPMENSSGNMPRIIGLAQDVTERKKWEEERIRNAKLESLGMLAGGLAHDFNNYLAAILGQLSLAKFGMSSAHPLYHRLTEAEQASLRAQDIAKQLLTFSKGGTPVKKTVSLNEMLEEQVRLGLAGSKIKPIFHISEDLWQASVDLGQISQVIHNLVINARQAMPNGGNCVIHAYNFQGDALERFHLSSTGPHPDHWVYISIGDEGVGISPANLKKIFDPYFTTKPSGSGLGLAMSYSIIRSHGGMLYGESELGVGSTFSLVLPAVLTKEVQPRVSTVPFKRGQGKILIMDDEAQIRRILGEMVQACGYDCKAVSDGDEAIRVFREAQESGESFSAVILDLTIPGGLGGKEVINSLLTLDPSVRAIVISGYSNDPVLANYQEYGFRGRVAKPFNLVDLSSVINTVISEVPS